MELKPTPDPEVLWIKINTWIDAITDAVLGAHLREYVNLYKNRYMSVPASATHHHTYDGGLMDHTIEVIEISISVALGLYHSGKISQEVDMTDFTNKLILISVIHDMQKVMVYKKGLGGWSGGINKSPYNHFEWVIGDWATKTNTELHDDVKRAIRTHHGGWSPKSGLLNNVMSAIVYSADLISSRL